MQRVLIFRWVMALPLRHKLTALGVAIAVVAACLVLRREFPVSYESSAILYFDQFASPQPFSVNLQQQGAAKHLADSILTDAQLTELAHALGLFAGNAKFERAAQFRSHLFVVQDSPWNLRVTWRGQDRSQAILVANSVAEFLAEQRTTQPNANVATPLIGDIDEPAPEPLEQSRLTAPQSISERESALSRYAQTSQEKIGKSVALSAIHSLKDTTKRKPFKILEIAVETQELQTGFNPPSWSGVTAGILIGLLYMAAAGKMSRMVDGEETLQQILPIGVTYLGSVPGMYR